MTSFLEKMLRGTFIVSASNLLAAIFNLLTTVLLLRILGVSDFGILALTLSAISMASIFLDLGIGSVVISDIAVDYASKKLGRVKSILMRYAQAEIAVGLCISAAFLIFAYANILAYDEKVIGIIKISSVLLFLYSLKNILDITFQAHSKFWLYSITQLIESASRFAMLYMAFSFFKIATLDKAVLIYSAATLLAIIVMIPSFIKTIKPLIKVEREKTNAFMNILKGHGKYAVVIQVLKNIRSNILVWIIKAFMDNYSVGVFSAAQKILEFIVRFINAIEQTLMPLISEMIGTKKDMGEKFVRIVKYLFYSSVILLAAIEISCTVFPDLVTSILSAKYSEALPLFMVMSFAIPLFMVNVPFNPLYFGLKSQKVLVKVYVFNFIVTLIGQAISVYFLGLWGAALAYIWVSMTVIFFKIEYLKKLPGDYSRINIRYLIAQIGKFDEYDRNFLSNLKASLARAAGRFSR